MSASRRAVASRAPLQGPSHVLTAGRSDDLSVVIDESAAQKGALHLPREKAYPVDSGGATCCALNDRIRPVAGTTIDGQRAFAFAISESVF